MRRALRWAIRIVVASLVLAIVAVCVALVLVHTDWGREQIRARAEAALQDAFPGARVGSLEGSVLGELVVRDLELPAAPGAPFLKAGAVRAEIALWPLLGNTVRVDRVIAEDVELVIAPGPEVDEAPDELDPAPSAPSAWQVELPAVTLRRASIAIRTTEQPLTIDASDASAAVTIARDGDVTAAGTVHGRWREREAEIRGELAVRIGDTLDVPHAELGIDGASIVAANVRITTAGAIGGSGRLVVDAPPEAIARLMPGVQLPGRVHATITARARGGSTDLEITGRLGDAPLHVLAGVDPAALVARGVLWSRGAALAPLTGELVDGTATAMVAFVATPEQVRASVSAQGTALRARAGDEVVSVPEASTVVAIEASVRQRRASAIVLATGPGGLRATAIGAVRPDGERVVVEPTYLVASTQDAAASSGGLAPASGRLATELVASGPLDALDVRGTVRGQRLRFDELAAARIDGRFALTLGRELAGSTHVAAHGVSRAGEPLGSVTVDARTRTGNTIAASVRARGATSPLGLDLAAVITPGEIIDIALGRHHVRTPQGTWRGDGGRVRIEPRHIVVRGVQSRLVHAGAPPAHVAIDARVQRDTGAVAAQVSASEVPLLGGTADAQLQVTLRGGRWAGQGTVRAQGVALAEDAPPLDGEARVTLAGRRVVLEGHAESPELGAAQIALELDGPRDVTDVHAWRRVPRRDVRSLSLRLARLDAAALTEGELAGRLDGTLEIRGGAPSGELALRDVLTPAGRADADVTLAEDDRGLIELAARTRVGSLGEATLGVRLRIPEHPFDPLAWQRLGGRVIDAATARAADVPFDPALLARFGFELPYHGRATLDASVATGGSAAQLALDVRGVHGGPLVRPVDVRIEGHADARATTATLRATTGERALVSLSEATTPVSIGRWLAAPARALTAPVTARVEIPHTPVQDVLAIVGRSDVTQGTLRGEVTIGGTLRAPTARGSLELAGVRARPRIPGRPAPELSALRLDGRWADGRAEMRLTGATANEGSLRVEVSGQPHQLASALGRVKIDDFDLATVAAFLPGQLVAASGKLDADLTVRGLDLESSQLRGRVALTDARVPISSAVGTLRRATASIAIDDAGVRASLSGRIGAGSIELAGKTGLDGKTLTFSGELARFSPIGSVQPVIDGKIAGTLRRDGTRLTGKATISEASVLVPEQSGTALLDEEAPADLIFVDGALPLPKKRAPRAPERPWLVADIEIEPVRIRVPDFAVDARAGGEVQVAVGDSLGIEGEIVVESGRAEVFGHRYRVDLGRVAFDGTTDPFVELELAHDFRDVTMVVRYAGRVSEIGEVEPELSSDPGIYSQGQLFGFFLGGEPGGDPSKQTSAAAANFGAALASTTFGNRLKKVIPVDVLRCDMGSDVSSRSCTIGKWLTPKTFLSYRHKLEARQDENTGDAKVEYFWKPNRVLEVTGGDRRFFGLDLLWRRRW